MRYFYEDGRREITTPTESIIRQPWYGILRSTFHDEWSNVWSSNAGSWRAVHGGKLVAAALRCLCCLPCNVAARAINGRREYNKQTGITYLYIFLCMTVVINLVVALKNIDSKAAEYVQKFFVIITMFTAISMMLRLFLFTYETVNFRESHGMLLRLFHLGGTYLFGFACFTYGLCVLMDYISCGYALDAVVTLTKAAFTLIQILFLHYFYEAIIPEDTPFIEITLAHLLGTNLALWFWTLCSEEASESLEKCMHHPIHLAGYDKYLTPLFVEYLLLAASFFYQIRSDMSKETSSSLSHRHCTTSTYAIEGTQNEASYPNNNAISTARRTTTASTRNNSDSDTIGRSSRSVPLGIFVGAVFAALFVLVILLSTENSASNQVYHQAYTIEITVLYLTQIAALLYYTFVVTIISTQPGTHFR